MLPKPSFGSGQAHWSYFEPSVSCGEGVLLVDLNPVVDNEMRDDHRCVVIIPREINLVGMCLTVPIAAGGALTRKLGLAVNISGHKSTGVALCNQVRAVDILELVKQKTAIR